MARENFVASLITIITLCQIDTSAFTLPRQQQQQHLYHRHQHDVNHQRQHDVVMATVTPSLKHDSNISNRQRLLLHALSRAAPLEPEENPALDPNAKSSSGISHIKALDGLHELFPPSDLDSRNAASRTDGYWAYIRDGKEPPPETTYGEFDFYFFAQLLELCKEKYLQTNNWNDVVFADIGSGTGRLVFAAASLHPDCKLCLGLELLNSIHVVAESTLEKCRLQQEQSSESFYLPHKGGTVDASGIKMAPIKFLCGSFEDPNAGFGDANLIFVFSSCMESSIMSKLSKSIAKQCKPGTIIMTTEYSLDLEGQATDAPPENGLFGFLPYRFKDDKGHFKYELLEKVSGYCWVVGGTSDVYIHRLVASA